jgi:NADH-quinone oxidoreductase subunit H
MAPPEPSMLQTFQASWAQFVQSLQDPVLFYTSIPEPFRALVHGVLAFALAALVGLTVTPFAVLMERKVLSWFTQRKGPNRVGPWGLFQTVADGIKFLFKEDIMVPGQDKWMFTFAPVLFLFPVFPIYALVPFSDQLQGLALPCGIIFAFALSSISVIGLVLAGWSSNNKYSLLGGMRSAAQAISYEIPLLLSVLSVVLLAGSMDMQTIVGMQKNLWYVFALPISFLVFYTASIAEVNRVPFDLPEAESELVSGYNTEYSGMKFAMFFLAEYAGLFIISALTAVLFFGGYYAPFGGLWVETLGIVNALNALPRGDVLATLLRQVEMGTWMILKTYFFVYVAFWIRGTLPRLKPDQLMGFSWKFLLPISLINLVLVAFLKFYQLNHDIIYALLALATGVFGIGGYCLLSSRILNQQFQKRFESQV